MHMRCCLELSHGEPTQVRDAGSLLSGAGFTLQTVDTEDMTVQYDDAADAITHIRVPLCPSDPDLLSSVVHLKAGGVAYIH